MNKPIPRQFALDISKTPLPSLSNFITSTKSVEQGFSITEILQHISKCWKKNIPIPPDFSWIYCWGNHGSGKSHLLKAMEIQANIANISSIFLSPGNQRSWDELAKTTTKLPDAILVDDVDQLNKEEQSLLFRTQIEAKEQAHVFLMISGAHSAPGLGLREDVQSRLSWGLNFELSVLSDAEKILAIHQIAQERGIILSSEVPTWLLSNFHRDLPSLLSLIEALDHFSLERKRAITLPLLREFLQSTLV